MFETMSPTSGGKHDASIASNCSCCCVDEVAIVQDEDDGDADGVVAVVETSHALVSTIIASPAVLVTASVRLFGIDDDGPVATTFMVVSVIILP